MNIIARIVTTGSLVIGVSLAAIIGACGGDSGQNKPSCILGDNSPTCADGGTDTGVDTGVTNQPVGSVCVFNTECATSLQCVNGRCSVPLGGFCSSNAQCPVNAQCVNGVCVAASNPGVCTSDAQCPNGYKCAGGVCVSGTNPPPPVTGHSVAIVNTNPGSGNQWTFLANGTGHIVPEGAKEVFTDADLPAVTCRTNAGSGTVVMLDGPAIWFTRIRFDQPFGYWTSLASNQDSTSALKTWYFGSQPAGQQDKRAASPGGLRNFVNPDPVALNQTATDCVLVLKTGTGLAVAAGGVTPSVPTMLTLPTGETIKIDVEMASFATKSVYTMVPSEFLAAIKVDALKPVMTERFILLGH